MVNLLTGLIPPSTGFVSFKGHDVGRIGALRLSRLGMARSFQLVNIFPLLSVRETIAVAAISNLGQGGRILASLRANKSVWDNVERVAHLFGFTAKLEQPAKSLSQGDKKLLDVASAFALKPEIIVLDEPTSGVSTAEKATIMVSTICPSLPIRTNAFGANVSAASAFPRGRLRLSIRPPPAAAPPCRNPRRDSLFAGVSLNRAAWRAPTRTRLGPAPAGRSQARQGGL